MIAIKPAASVRVIIVFVTTPLAAVETFKVWQCIGCGRIDHPQPCVGICQDRKVEMVNASDYRIAQARVGALEALLRRIAFTTPRTGEWDSAWRALQGEARGLFRSGHGPSENS